MSPGRQGNQEKGKKGEKPSIAGKMAHPSCPVTFATTGSFGISCTIGDSPLNSLADTMHKGPALF
jgi:hypothetical protein